MLQYKVRKQTESLQFMYLGIKNMQERFLFVFLDFEQA